MNQKQVYKGTVRTGHGGGVIEMSKPGVLEEFRRFTGLSLIPGTLKYVNFADIGWEFDPATQRIPYKGEIGMYYGRVAVAKKCPSCLIFFTWVTHKDSDGELVSPHHLRSVLNLRDGDIVEFVLDI